MNELIGRRIIRWDTEKNGLGDLSKVVFILDDGKRVTFEVFDYPNTELNVKID